MKLPTQNLKDLSKLSIEEVRHEYDLCFEVLNGVYVNGQLVIKGMLFENPEERDNKEQFLVAVNHWKNRLKRVEDELVDRELLS